MSEQQQDPSANTAQFQAFVQRTEAEPQPRSSRLLLIVVVLAAVVVLGVILAVVLSS
jgi:hypothetical protein